MGIFVNITPLYWAIASVVFLSLYELFTTIIMSKNKAVSANRSINLFMALKAGKILLSGLFLLIYYLVVRIEVKRFILVFAVIYLFFLIFDTVYFVLREKKSKQLKDKE